MSRLTNVIEAVKVSRLGENRAWIYDENGNISNDVICGDIIPYLEELKNYEIDATDEFISEFKKDADNYYSYNYSDCIDKDISIWYKKGSPIAIICVHLFGDARWGFSDDFVVEMDDYYDDCVLTQLFQLDSVYQIVNIDIDNRYYADINIFAEEYEIYDSIKGETIDTDYTIEKDDILNKLGIDPTANDEILN
jgi:hypothetical protein